MKDKVIVTEQKYINGQLVAETAKYIKNVPGFWSYVLPALIGIATYWQIVAWG